MITPEQCRGARGLLGWTQGQLAEQAQVGVVTIRNFEGYKSTPMRGTLVLLEQTFGRAGVEFIEQDSKGPGVRLTRPVAVQGRFLDD